VGRKNGWADGVRKRAGGIKRKEKDGERSWAVTGQLGRAKVLGSWKKKKGKVGLG
jgi:hypothetical protein